ncbi:ras gtpase-activating protein [Anaeramoeba ignava]|uniref:Ras gtpase-activating protein n=1 Tax=Anaeramoeba ignava TaxID=1746090 RepID=A0A9Q0RB70_ANAIG|nr:ras gtpase-activating protein [Anaeramoeba ignava]
MVKKISCQETFGNISFDDDTNNEKNESKYKYIIHLKLLNSQLYLTSNNERELDSWINYIQIVRNFVSLFNLIPHPILSISKMKNDQLLSYLYNIYHWIVSEIKREEEENTSSENLLQLYQEYDEFSFISLQHQLQLSYQKISHLELWKNRVLYKISRVEFSDLLQKNPDILLAFSERPSGIEIQIFKQKQGESTTHHLLPYLNYSQEKWFVLDRDDLSNFEKKGANDPEHSSQFFAAHPLEKTEKSSQKGLVFSKNIHIITPEILSFDQNTLLQFIYRQFLDLITSSIPPPVYFEGYVYFIPHHKFRTTSCTKAWMRINKNVVEFFTDKFQTKNLNTLKLGDFSIVKNIQIKIDKEVTSKGFEIVQDKKPTKIGSFKEQETTNLMAFFEKILLFRNFPISIDTLFSNDILDSGFKAYDLLINIRDWMDTQVAEFKTKLEEISKIFYQNDLVLIHPKEQEAMKKQYLSYSKALQQTENWRKIVLSYLLRHRIGKNDDNKPRAYWKASSTDENKRWFEIANVQQISDGKIDLIQEQEIKSVIFENIDIIFPIRLRDFTMEPSREKHHQPKETKTKKPKKTENPKKKEKPKKTEKPKKQKKPKKTKQKNVDPNKPVDTTSSGLSQQERESLLVVLLLPQMILPFCLLEEVNIREMDMLCKNLIFIFEYVQQPILPLLKQLIEAEIKSTTSEAVLFRGKSTAIKIISEFCGIYGKYFLEMSIKKPLEKVIEANKTLEIYPGKVESDEQLKENITELIEYSEIMLNQIFESLYFFPIVLRELNYKLFQITAEKFPSSRYVIVAGLVFLRLICPAIVAPEIFGLASSPPNKDARRALVLISKVIQSIANGMMFDLKSPMAVCNPLLEKMIPLTKKFMDRLLQPCFEVKIKEDYPSLDLKQNQSVVCLGMSDDEKTLFAKITPESHQLIYDVRKIPVEYVDIQNKDLYLDTMFESVNFESNQLEVSLKHIHSLLSNQVLFEKVNLKVNEKIALCEDSLSLKMIFTDSFKALTQLPEFKLD